MGKEVQVTLLPEYAKTFSITGSMNSKYMVQASGVIVLFNGSTHLESPTTMLLEQNKWLGSKKYVDVLPFYTSLDSDPYSTTPAVTVKFL